MPRTRDPNYDTRAEYEMDQEPDKERHRCQCGQLATIKTTYNARAAIYHCSEQCKQWWLRVDKKVARLDTVERKPGGFEK